MSVCELSQMLNCIGTGAAWPATLLHARTGIMGKSDICYADAMSFQMLSILPHRLPPVGADSHSGPETVGQWVGH